MPDPAAAIDAVIAELLTDWRWHHDHDRPVQAGGIVRDRDALVRLKARILAAMEKTDG